jgi:hypothetical protein
VVALFDLRTRQMWILIRQIWFVCRELWIAGRQDAGSRGLTLECALRFMVASWGSQQRNPGACGSRS